MTKTLTAALLVLTLLVAGTGAQEPPISLEGLVVTASPTPRPEAAMSTHVTVLDGDELRARGFTRLEEALRGEAGITVARSGSMGALTSLFMRGGESDYVLFLVDGVQVNLPGGAFDLASLSLTNVERIEIVRGPASALYGSDAVAGVVNVITRAGAGRASVEASLRAGSYGRRDWNAGASGGAEEVGWSVALSRERTEGILPFNNEHRHTVFSGAMRFRPRGSTEADLSVRLADRTYHFPTDGSGALTDRNSFTFGDEAVVSARLRRDLSSALGVEATLGLSEIDGGTDDEPDGPADTLGFYAFTSLDHLRRAQADVRAHVRARDIVLTVGGELESERQRSFNQSRSQFGPSSGRSESERDNRAAYVHATAERGGVALNAGARLEDNERFGRLGTWQLGVAWTPAPTPWARIRASAASGIKEPTFFENYATGFAVGNPDLDPERARSLEVGVDLASSDGRAEVGATLFQQSFRDLIQFTATPPTPGGPSFYNVAAADSRGVEVTASGGAGPLSLSGSWTWLDTEVVDAGFESGPGASFVEGEPLLRRPVHSAHVSATVELGARGTASGGVRFVGSRADRDFTTFPAAPVTLQRYATVWIGGSAEVLRGEEGGPALTVTFGGDNLLDGSRQEVFGFAAPGRRLFVGARLGLVLGG